MRTCHPLLVLPCLSLLACASGPPGTLRTRAAEALACPEGQVSFEAEGEQAFRASGCGASVRYDRVCKPRNYGTMKDCSWKPAGKPASSR